MTDVEMFDLMSKIPSTVEEVTRLRELWQIFDGFRSTELPTYFPQPESWKKYNFTVNWFRMHLGYWSRLLIPWRALWKEFHGLEIGCYEAMSTVWLLENQCIGSVDTLISLDPYDGLNGESWRAIYERAKNNIKLSGRENQCWLITKQSDLFFKEMLTPEMLRSRINFIYIDGNHSVEAVYRDSVNAWNAIVSEGLILWDDWFCPIATERAEVQRGVTRFFNEKRLKIRFLGPAVFAIKA